MRTSYPKPPKRRRGRSVKRNKKIRDAAAARDKGLCIAGLILKDGCVGMLGVAHIHSWGGHGQSSDVLENLITLCNRHHRMHEEGVLSDIFLQGVLYTYYGYGPPADIIAGLEKVKDIASDIGMSVSVKLWIHMAHVLFRGTFSRFELPITYDALRSELVTELVKDAIARKSIHHRQWS